MSENVTIS